MKVLNVDGIASYLNCSTSTIRKLVRNKQIPFFRVGYRLCFNPEAVNQWIKEQEEENILGTKKTNERGIRLCDR